MKITAALSWFEESPIWLSSLVASMAPLIDAVVAVDGAYFLYPEALAHPTSGPEQAEAIIQACAAANLGCTIHTPTGPWMGNETEKRTFLFQLATMQSTEDDWLFVVDGDDIIRSIPPDAREMLEETDKHVAEVSLWWREDWEANEDKTQLAHWLNGEARDDWTVNHRALIRALPDLHCGYAHMIYEATDPDTNLLIRLRGQVNNDDQPLAEALDLTMLKVEHRHSHRNPARQANSDLYYKRRDELNVEAMPQPVAGGAC